MAEPADMILPLLREMRADMTARFDSLQAEINKRFDGVGSRFDQLEGKVENVKQVALGESVLGRYAALEVEDRLEEIEKRLAALEGR